MPIVDTDNVPLTGIATHRLADMAGVQLDLRWTAGACAQILRRQIGPREDSMAIEAFHDAALIRYARCFKKGMRKSFQVPIAWIDALPQHLKEIHQLALDVRDKHIAHSVNDWENNVPVAQIATIRGSGISSVRAVHVQQMRVVMLGKESLQNLHELAKALADRVYSEMADEQKKLLEEIRGISPKELRRRAPKPFPEVGRRGAGKTRRRN